jgi:hypothetical protein
MGALFGGLGWWARDSMTKTRFNRAIMAVVFLEFVTQTLLQVGTGLLGVSVITSSVLNLFLWGTLTAALAGALERRLTLAATGFLVAFLVACLRPAWRWQLMSAANALLTVNMLWIWKPSTLRRPPREAKPT